MAFCPHCGTQVTEGVAFCPNCGKAAGAAGSTATPPSPPTGPIYTNTAAGSAPLADNIAGMLAYFTIIPAVVFLLVEPYNRNRFVRFHSFQCLFTAVALVILHVALLIVAGVLHVIPLIGSMIMLAVWPLLWIAEVVLWLLLVIKAYQGQMFKLPFVGDLAEKQAGA